MDFFITPESYLAAVRSPCCGSCFRRISSRLSIRELCALRRTRALLRWLNTNRPQLTVAVYGVGAGAVDPSGTGEGASVEPCVFGGFLFADLFEAEAGVGDGLLVAAVVVLVPVVPDCSHDARNAMPIRTAIKEITCFFIDSASRGAESQVVLNQMSCWEWCASCAR